MIDCTGAIISTKNGVPCVAWYELRVANIWCARLTASPSRKIDDAHTTAALNGPVYQKDATDVAPIRQVGHPDSELEPARLPSDVRGGHTQEAEVRSAPIVVTQAS